MRVHSVLAAALLLFAAPAAVAVDPGEWSGTSSVIVRSRVRGSTLGWDRLTWAEDDLSVLSEDGDQWSLTASTTGVLLGTVVPLGETIYRAQAKGDDFVDWASRVVSPRSMLPEIPEYSDQDLVYVQDGSLRGVLDLNRDASIARLLLRGRWRGTVMSGRNLGFQRYGTIRVLMQGERP